MNTWQRALMIELKTNRWCEVERRWRAWPQERQRRFEATFQAALRVGASPVMVGDAQYPIGWSRLSQPPVGAWLRGRWDDEGQGVGIVGSRAAPPAVCARVRAYAADCVVQGDRVISGAAVGVDTAAHVGAGSAGSIAVVPFGIEGPRVGQGQLTVEQICGAGGAVWGAALLRDGARQRYVARNQLLAGLCDRLLVAHAALKSGTMHTVRFAQALDLRIDAWWTPGDPSTNDGCREILGAGLPLQPMLRDLLKALRKAKGRVRGVDRRRFPELALLLLELECEGWIRSVGPGLYDCGEAKKR